MLAELADVGFGEDWTRDGDGVVGTLEMRRDAGGTERPELVLHWSGFDMRSAVEEALAPLLDDAERTGVTVLVLSEYGITAADRPVDVNRMLRRNGLLEVYTQDGMEYLDPWTSRAFAVADHQVAHVYVRDPADVPAVAALCAGLPGVAEVLDGAGKAAHALDHPRAGELVLVADPDAWFTYYYWRDDAAAPDFARLVEIHR